MEAGTWAVSEKAAVMAELSEALLSVLPSIRVPKVGDRVHKDECAFSFDTPVSAPKNRPGAVRDPGGAAPEYSCTSAH